MSKARQPCKICGKSRDEATFKKWAHICSACRMAPKVCGGCSETKSAEKFHCGCSLCNSCRYRAKEEEHKEAARRRHFGLQKLVFEAYGNDCACCGEKRRSMLTVDHVNNDGADHRRALGAHYRAHRWRNANIGGTSLYRDLVKRGFPEGFQLLCANCNASKSRNGGICEHQTERATTIPKGSTLQVIHGSGSAGPLAKRG